VTIVSKSKKAPDLFNLLIGLSCLSLMCEVVMLLIIYYTFDLYVGLIYLVSSTSLGIVIWRIMVRWKRRHLASLSRGTELSPQDLTDNIARISISMMMLLPGAISKAFGLVLLLPPLRRVISSSILPVAKTVVKKKK
jgi:UPF0716 family protein affecting phage T7 exclusion